MRSAEIYDTLRGAEIEAAIAEVLADKLLNSSETGDTALLIKHQIGRLREMLAVAAARQHDLEVVEGMPSLASGQEALENLDRGVQTLINGMVGMDNECVARS